MKTTFNGPWPLMEDDLKNWKTEYFSSHLLDPPQNLNISSCDQTKIKKGFNEDDLQWKTTSNGRWPLMEDDLKIWKVEYLSSHWSDLPQILNINLWDQTKVKKGFNVDDLQWETTFNGRWPQNMESWISQQPLIGSSSNFKHKLMGPKQSQKRFRWKRPSMEDIP